MQAEAAVKPDSGAVTAENIKEMKVFDDDVKGPLTDAAPERKKSLAEEFKLWRRAVFWSVNISLTIVMESYDTILKNQFYAYPQFQKKFGIPNPNGKGFVIEAKWQSALGSGTFAGMCVGIILGGLLIERIGYRWTMILGLILNTAFIFPMFFAESIEIYFAGNMLCALPWGVFSTAAPAFAAEVAPRNLRRYLVAWTNQCWVLGHVLAAGILKGMITNTTEWSYKIPLALQWMWPLPIAILIYFSPESPYHLVKRGKIAEAEKSVARLHEPDSDIDDKAYVAGMVETIRLEKEMRIGANYADCFRGTNLRRTEIACVSWSAQALVGFCVQNFATYFFTRAGIPPSQAFALGLGNYCIAFVGNIGCWVLMTYYGQRTIMLSGFAIMIPTMLLVGFLDLAKTSAARWAQAIMLLVWFLWYGLTVGPIPYIIASEAGAAQLRAKTIGIGRIAYSVFFILNNVIAPYMLTTWNMKGKAAFPAAGFTILLLIWGYFRLPEMTGRSFEELDILYGRKVPARQFSRYKIEEEDRRAQSTA